MLGTLFKIKRYALHDGPGIRTTVFFKGCPLSCRWCHNPEGIDPHPQTISRRTSAGDVKETVGTVIGVDDLMTAIEKDVLFYDESDGGVTFSGGEPLAQPKFLEAVLKACNEKDIHTVLDTSGYAPGGVLERLLPRVGIVLFDLKIMNEKRHLRFTGVPNRVILENLGRVSDSRTPVRIRVPVIPGVTDDENNVREIVRFAKTLTSIEGVDLLPFHRIGLGKYNRLGITGHLAGIAPPTPQRMNAIEALVLAAGLPVSTGG